MKNRTKDKITIIAFLITVFVVLVSISLLFIFFIENIVQAENKEINLTEQQQINKFYTEERIKAEMYYLSAWNCIESMTEEEYTNTFYKENQNV